MSIIATHCRQGHEFTEENTLRQANGRRSCLRCGEEAEIRRLEKTKDGLALNRVQYKTTHCPKGHEYTEENSYVNPSSGYRQCKTCIKERQQREKNDPNHILRMRKYRTDWRENNPEYHKFNQLLRDYKITEEEYSRRMVAQDNRCLICQNEFSETVLPHVDHDHNCCSGRKYTCGKCVRGFLCALCNQGLGQFKDNSELLEKAASYLKTFQRKS